MKNLKQNKVVFRVTNEEYDELKHKSFMENKNLSSYIRGKILMNAESDILSEFKEIKQLIAFENKLNKQTLDFKLKEIFGQLEDNNLKADIGVGMLKLILELEYINLRMLIKYIKRSTYYNEEEIDDTIEDYREEGRDIIRDLFKSFENENAIKKKII